MCGDGCVTAPKGDGKSLEEMSGSRGRVPRASSLRYSLAKGVDGVDGIFGKPPSASAIMGMQSTLASQLAERLPVSLHCTPICRAKPWVTDPCERVCC